MNTWSEWDACTDLRAGWQVRIKGCKGCYVFEYRFQSNDGTIFKLHDLDSAKDCDRCVCHAAKNIRDAQVAIALLHYYAAGDVPKTTIGKLMHIYGIISTQQLRECATNGLRVYRESVPSVIDVVALDANKLIDTLLNPVMFDDTDSTTDSDLSFYSL